MRFALNTTAAIAVILFPSGVFAVGSQDTKPPTPTQTTVECEDGQIWDEKTEKCVVPKDAHLDDDKIYNTARELAYDGQYEFAISVLYLAENRNDPRILNYLGFANRKAGRVEVGMGYYRQAIQIDPDYILARSYMGQSLVNQGKIKEARLQLKEIQARGGRGTWAEEALYKALHGTGQAGDY